LITTSGNKIAKDVRRFSTF